MRARGAPAHGPGRPEGERTEKGECERGEKNPKLLLPNTERDLEMIMREKDLSTLRASHGEVKKDWEHMIHCKEIHKSER